LAGLGAAVGIGAWHAKSTVHASGASQRSTTAKTTSSPNLAAALYQNSHLMTARSDYARSGAGEPGVRIVIPAIGLDAPVVPTGIVSGVWQVADWAVGYLQGSALPGQCTEFQ